MYPYVFVVGPNKHGALLIIACADGTRNSTDPQLELEQSFDLLPSRWTLDLMSPRPLRGLIIGFPAFACSPRRGSDRGTAQSTLFSSFVLLIWRN